MIDFETDDDNVEVGTHKGKRLSAHERCMPVCKELFNRLDRLGEADTEEFLSLLRNKLNIYDQRLAAAVPVPKGNVVSCLSANPRAPSKHKKQT